MLIFADGFDHYNDASLKWTAPNGATIDLTGTKSRTGIGAMLCTSAGPGNQKSIASKSGFVCGRAYMTNGGNNSVFGFIGPGHSQTVHQVDLIVNADGSMSVITDQHNTLGQTIGGLIPFNQTYVYVEMKVTFSNPGGQVAIRVNGQQVLQCSGNTDPDGTGLANIFYLQGPGGGTVAYADDVYLLDLLGGINNDFWGPVRIFAGVPVSDSAPLQWTPSSAGTHFSLVNAIPQNNGATFVEDNTVGEQDQYIHAASGIAPPVSILGVQHCMDAQLDIAGARQLGSSVGGVVSAGQSLTTAYQIKTFVYDTNPVTGLPFALTDFTTTPFGPDVAA